MSARSLSKQYLCIQHHRNLLFAALCLASVCDASWVSAEELVVVRAGEPIAANVLGGEWKMSASASSENSVGLSAEGVGRLLYASQEINSGDFSIDVALKLDRIDGTAASLQLGSSHIGFDSRSRRLFVEGPLFRGLREELNGSALPKTEQMITPEKLFNIQVTRTSGLLSATIDGESCFTFDVGDQAVGRVGLRPWRNRMTVANFQISGNLVTPPPLPKPLGDAIFAKGQDGYNTFRIPAIVTTNEGTLLAFCEGRRSGSGDSGNIDLVMRRSIDAGETWSDLIVIWDDAGNTCGNPCPIVDRSTGVVWLLMTWNLGEDHEREIIDGKSTDTRRVYVSNSDNDGLEWSLPREITTDVKLSDWTWYATGPGSGIQIEHGKHSGRMVAACDHIESQTKRRYSHSIFSDDHGATWQLGGRTPRDGVNECEVVELSDGRLLLNMRNYDRSKQSRQVAVSGDGGETWGSQEFDEALIEPICQAALMRMRWPTAGLPGVILFSNPASRSSRSNLTVRASLDDGETWSLEKKLFSGPSAYSDLTILGKEEIVCLYEAGGENPYQSIVFAKVNWSAMKQAE